MNKRTKQIALLCLLGVMIGTFSAWMQGRQDGNEAGALAQIEPAAGSALAGAEIGGPFTLTDHNGDTVTEQDYAGSYKLVFFGFTYCPHICPTELQKITAALGALGPESERIKPLFITTDPERDSPQVMKAYLENFHPALTGLTGTAEQLKKVQDTYKVYAAKVNDPALSEYTINHSSFTFLMSPDDQLLSLFSTQDTAADMTAEISRVLQTQ